MLEDLFDSIKFYVEEQPLDLVHNIVRTFKWETSEIQEKRI
jgi:hypothetical protein